MSYQEIKEILTELKFRGMLTDLDNILADAEKQGLPIANTLLTLLRQELYYRKERSLANRIKNAHIPHNWTLSSFPFERQPNLNKSQIMSLSGTAFVERGQNIVFIGETGTGKSGLAMGLLRQALTAGYRGRFYDVQFLLDDLYSSLADRSTAKILKKLCGYDILVLDELGYLTLRPEQMNAFFKLMSERYQSNKATIITTNLDYQNWYDLFKPKEMVDAMLDRLRHHCSTIQIQGTSIRQSDAPSL